MKLSDSIQIGRAADGLVQQCGLAMGNPMPIQCHRLQNIGSDRPGQRCTSQWLDCAVIQRRSSNEFHRMVCTAPEAIAMCRHERAQARGTHIPLQTVQGRTKRATKMLRSALGTAISGLCAIQQRHNIDVVVPVDAGIRLGTEQIPFKLP